MYPLRSVAAGDQHYLHETTSPPPFGPGFTAAEAQQAEVMEVWATSFKDAGPDFTEFRLVKAGQVIATRRVNGY